MDSRSGAQYVKHCISYVFDFEKRNPGKVFGIAIVQTRSLRDFRFDVSRTYALKYKKRKRKYYLQKHRFPFSFLFFSTRELSDQLIGNKNY